MFFSPSTKSRHRARGHHHHHHHHHHHNDRDMNINPADVNDAEFHDFVRETSQQMMMKEIAKQKRIQQQQQQLLLQQRATNKSERHAAKSLQKAVASITQEEYEIRLLKARLAELERASRG